VTFADVAREAHLGHDLPMGMALGLDETYFFDPVDMPFAYGTHIAVVEVDVETGQVALLRHVVVDDCGRIINPLLVEGQVHGGAAQGIGQALMEAMVHGVGGEPRVSGFGEYAMPRAADLPAFETGHTEVPTKLNPLGAKGVGEGATIGATPAVVNAVLDALAPLGVTEVPMPMTPMRVWQAIERAREGRGGLAPATGAEASLPNGSQAGTSTPLGRGTKGGNNA
jgi:aerobic carbon-monoxide dehydrogenase large subunit